MRIDQAGLSAGSPGIARDDGLSDGSLVTVTSLSHQTSFEVALLWVGLHGVVDTTSRATLQKASANSYTFEPTAGALGSWRIELVTDRGTAAEDRQVRIFAVRDGGLRIPAANEQADPEANLINSGSAYVARSEFNAGDGVADSPQEDASYVSHWRPIADLIHAHNGGAGGGAPADGRYLMGGYYDDAALPFALAMSGGYCTEYNSDEGGTPPIAWVDAYAPGMTARIRWTAIGDVPISAPYVINMSPFGAAAIPTEPFHGHAAISFDVWASTTFVGLQIPTDTPKGSSVSTISIELLNVGSQNVVLTHNSAQPGGTSPATAPFRTSTGASYTLTPYTHVHAVWNAADSHWVILT
jgi:hypothetical protein